LPFADPGDRAASNAELTGKMPELSATASPLMLLSGTANRGLAERISGELDRPLCDVTIKRFADGEIFVGINENVRGRDVFLIQPTSPPAANILELLLLIDAAKRASAARITAVVPYYGYGRQDRKDQPRVSIAAKLMANLITAAGADRLLGIDFHQHQIQGFFDIPVDHLYAAPVFMEWYKDLAGDVVVVASDVGAAKMTRGYAKRFGADIAIIDKRHDGGRGAGAPGARSEADLLAGDARPVLRPRHRAPSAVADRGDRRHGYDPGLRRCSRGAEQPEDPIRGQLAGSRDREHALQPLGELAVRLTTIHELAHEVIEEEPMTKQIKLKARHREERGKAKARKLRREGSVPATMYGHGFEPQSLRLDEREFSLLLGRISAGSTLIDLEVDDAPARKVLIREVQRHPWRPSILHVDFFRINVDEEIKVSVPLHGDSLLVSDVDAGGITVLDDPDSFVAAVIPPTILVVEEPEEEEELEGELEPEVIGEEEAGEDGEAGPEAEGS
jgi:ribose-phosphate pyrophosphokinase